MAARAREAFSQIDRNASAERWIPSTCGLCSIGCGVDVGVSGGEIVGVRGRAGHAVNDGRFGPKG
jgi:ferredoxin-nitrate reductase